jgi:hypothetical protein
MPQPVTEYGEGNMMHGLVCSLLIVSATNVSCRVLVGYQE